MPTKTRTQDSRLAKRDKFERDRGPPVALTTSRQTSTDALGAWNQLVFRFPQKVKNTPGFLQEDTCFSPLPSSQSGSAKVRE